MENKGQIDPKIKTTTPEIEKRGPKPVKEKDREKDIENIKNKIKFQIETDEVNKEFAKLPEEDKEKIEFGLKTMGFLVEQKKNKIFAGIFNKILEKLPEGKTVSRFCKELRDTFIRDSEKAYKTAEAVTSGREKHKIQNAGILFGNILRYGRMITDLTGASLASPLRYVMMGSMAFTRASEAVKETRLTNENVIEKTRIQDADKAAEEAWGIYERAQATTNDVSAEALKNAYLMEMPTDLANRLQETSTSNNFVQNLLRKHLMFDINRISESLDKIYSDPKLSLEEKEEKENKLIKRQEKKLMDYDRILTQYGTVDELAMAGRYAQTVGKTVVTVMTVETLILSAERMWEYLSHAFSDVDISLPTSSTKVGADKIITGEIEKQDIQQNQKIAPTDSLQTENTPVENAPIPPQQPPVIEHHINPEAIVGEGQGITQAFAAQIRADHDLAQKLGFTGDFDNDKDMAQFTRDLAIKTGYMDTEGHEIRVAEADKMAYELKSESGQVVVSERNLIDKTEEIHREGDKFESTPDKYEYNDGKIYHYDKNNVITEYVDSANNNETIARTEYQNTTEEGGKVSTNTQELTPDGYKTANTPAKITANNFLHSLYEGKSELDQENIRNILQGNAIDLFDAKESDVNPRYLPIFKYMHEIRNVTGITPKEGDSNLEYINSGLKKADELHKLNELVDEKALTNVTEIMQNTGKNENIANKMIEFKNLKAPDNLSGIEEFGIRFADFKLKFVYDNLGKPTKFSWGGTIGNTFDNNLPLTEDYYRPVIDYATQHKIDISFEKNFAKHNIVNMYTQISMFEEIKNNPEYFKESGFLKQVIFNEIDNLNKKYGNFVDLEKLPFEFSFGKGLSVEQIENITKTHTSNINLLAKVDHLDWKSARTLSAQIMNFDKRDNLTGLRDYMHKLEEVTGLKPEPAVGSKPSETVYRFVNRALAQAAKIGKLDQVRLTEKELVAPYLPTQR